MEALLRKALDHAAAWSEVQDEGALDKRVDQENRALDAGSRA